MNTNRQQSDDKKDLTVSAVDRQNILNHPYALSEIEKAVGIKGIPFEGKSVVLKEQVASFFEVSTIHRRKVTLLRHQFVEITVFGSLRINGAIWRYLTDILVKTKRD